MGYRTLPFTPKNNYYRTWPMNEWETNIRLYLKERDREHERDQESSSKGEIPTEIRSQPGWF